MGKIKNEIQLKILPFSFSSTFLFSTQNILHNNIFTFEISNYNLKISSQTEIIFYGILHLLKERVISPNRKKTILQFY